MDRKERQQIILRTSWISVWGNAFLSLLKILIGFISGSLAVLADGIDSASDVVTSLITVITAKMIGREPNLKYPYGYDKADTIASSILAFIIFFAGAQLAISSVQNLWSGAEREMPALIAIYVTIISIIGKVILARIQIREGKRVDSAMLSANGLNMQNDVVISLSVLTGLIFTFVLKLPIIDTITAILVSGYIMYTAVRIFLRTNLQLMDGVDDPNVYVKVFKAISRVKGVYHPHNVKIRHLADRYLIAVDIEVDIALSVKDGHDLAHRVDDEIRKEIPIVYDIIVHVEPYGGNIPDAQYGVSQEEIKED
jgi:cation diffusion facilitator family transporter